MVFHLSEAVNMAKSMVIRAGGLLKHAASREIACNYKNHDHRDLLTEFDERVQSLVIAELKKNYPDHKFISEEKHNNGDLTGYVWILDPIDGTTNFVCFKKNFSISLALYKDGKPVFGIVYDAVNDDLYQGISGEGAYLNNKRINNLTRIPLKNCIINISLNSIEELYNKYRIKIFNLAKDVRGHRYFGAASLELCKIATGELNIYISTNLKSWDFAAAGIILNEVGGYYGGIDHMKLDLTGKPTALVACSSKELYHVVLEKVFQQPSLYKGTRE
ncbi:inositol monophosphatase family protein [Desulfitibacter alkalitolerans]|uniref:inositol monophosphatase family protein n=1 Tax=Desulfitibacter alkalitolerans TaxID=264641 RepID=UPI000686B347|nr:inositol monophosphatase [Desulfitibacter alkalitolerans]